ncbi:MAG: GIY-YIG nuclease family protein [Chitinophagales bacterium]|nr:GIY-YIG nuclease family protein [Chitinophagales bacterium]
MALVKKYYYVYMLSNVHRTTLYTGFTGNLLIRIWQHKKKVKRYSFSAKYNCDRLVYFEMTDDVLVAKAREKQLKNWKREWKETLVHQENPNWEDLAENWYDSEEWLFAG